MPKALCIAISFMKMIIQDNGDKIIQYDGFQVVLKKPTRELGVNIFCRTPARKVLWYADVSDAQYWKKHDQFVGVYPENSESLKATSFTGNEYLITLKTGKVKFLKMVK
jgi:hypothetical protein